MWPLKLLSVNLFFSHKNCKTQENLNSISKWTDENLMEINELKSNYLIFTWSKQQFATRFTINNQHLERLNITKILGVWISEDGSWTKNTQEIIKKGYSRLGLLTKLKYAGVSIEDLLEIYQLFICSCAEYCSVAFHSSLTEFQSRSLERLQSTCLKVILQDNYVSYSAALEMTGIETLYERREKRCLNYSIKSIRHPSNSRFFPLNHNFDNGTNVRERENFHINFARTEDYKKSAIPYCQRLLNSHFENNYLPVDIKSHVFSY